MRHKVAGYKLGRNTAHRRSLLRNLVTSVIVEERIETTVPKAKAARPIVEKMITLGKRGDLAARRLAGAYLMTDEAVVKLFDTVGPRFGDRQGGYTRIIRTHWNKGDGADKAFLELLGSEKILDEKKEKRAEGRAKINSLLRTFYSLLEDLMFLQSGAPQLVRNTDILGELKKLSEAADFSWVQRAAEGLGEVERGLRRNLLRSLSLDAFATALERVS